MAEFKARVTREAIKGEKLAGTIHAQIGAIKHRPQWVQAFFRAPNVAHIADG
jgi:hypothetical protein